VHSTFSGVVFCLYFILFFFFFPLVPLPGVFSFIYLNLSLILLLVAGWVGQMLSLSTVTPKLIFHSLINSHFCQNT